MHIFFKKKKIDNILIINRLNCIILTKKKVLQI